MRRLVAALALPVVLLAACDGAENGGGDDVAEDTVRVNNERVQEIVAGLDDPAAGFTKVDGTYRDDFDAKETVTITAYCDSCEGRQVIEETVGAVWRSDITPLHALSVSVHGPEGYVYESYVLPDDEDELIGKYGERPTP